MELNDLDREILGEVTADPFASNAAVAKKLGIATSMVSGRLKAMQRKNISQVLAVLDLDHMNQSFCFVYIQTRGRSIEEIACEIAKLRMTLMVNELSNDSYDLLVLLRFNDIHSLRSSLFDDLAKIQGVRNWSITTVVDVPVFRSEYLTFGNQYRPMEVAQNIDYLSDDIPHGMCDEIDLQIIAHLQQNAHQSINNVARKLGIKPSTARYRINRLKSEDILRFLRVIDNSSIGIHCSAVFEINAEIPHVKRIVDVLHDKPWLPQLFLCAGRTTMIGLVLAKDISEVLRIKRDEIMSIKGIVSANVIFMNRNFKNDYRWAQVSR
jgi:Lrp/AsnC family transcriptional regulator, leucine-responsive regulatory protein